jgi:hypothetical protein
VKPIPLLIVVALLVAGCGREPAAPARRAPADAVADAIAAATATERRYQKTLSTSRLDVLPECTPGEPDAVRLVEIGGQSQGYSLAITSDPRGAVAIWQGLQHSDATGYQAYGPHGMRLDGNAWRQVRDRLEDPLVLEFARRDAMPIPDPDSRIDPSVLVVCLQGVRSTLHRASSPDSARAFDRAAVTMRRLAGNYYSPPAHASE